MAYGFRHIPKVRTAAPPELRRSRFESTPGTVCAPAGFIPFGVPLPQRALAIEQQQRLLNELNRPISAVMKVTGV